MADQLPAGQVTIADLYRELVGMRGDVSKALTRLEVIDGRNGIADGLHADHEQRIRMLEAFRWKVAGLALAMSVLTGVLAAWLPAHLH